MRYLKFSLQIVFFAFILALLLGRSASAVISHDENQFVAAGEFLAYHGLLPYVDFPYTHMPYGMAIYALAISLSPYPYLAARILNVLIWLASLITIVALSRTIRRPSSALAEPPTWPELFWEFALVVAFIYHPVSAYVLSAALNHSIATLFSLLSLLFFVRASRPDSFSYRDPLYSGIFVALATFSRFNYASLIVVLLILWALHAFVFHASRWLRTLVYFAIGGLAASLPAIALAVAAPAQFYYGNLVYIRLNTVYYDGLLYRYGMDLPSKFTGFVGGLLHRPLDWILYASLAFLSVLALTRIIRRRTLMDLGLFATCGFAFVLWLTAYGPTPGMAQYFFAPLPFLLVLLCWLALELNRFGWRTYVAGSLILLASLIASTSISNPLKTIAILSQPSAWTPIKVHDFAVSLKEYVPPGRILTLLPMVPMEARFDAYSFAATGPFSWRTSPLLTPQRRQQYHVTSPEDLSALLAAQPPVGILTGFEAPNAGFEFQDLGGLETPFKDYAAQHGYRSVELSPSFLEHPLILWIPP